MAKRTQRRKPPKTLKRKPPKSRLARSDSYWDVTHRPLQCLVFLLPMVLAFEFGMVAVHPNLPPDERPKLAAQQLLQWFFSLFGLNSLYLPGVVLVVVLFVWHLAGRQPWNVRWQPLAGMAGESVLLAIPLLLLNDLIRQPALQAIRVGPASTLDKLLLSVGAGIYEELVFRLIVISLLTLLLIDISRMRQVPGVALAVILSSLMFAAHHHWPIGADPWSASKFAFRAAAGAYLAAVFVVRGFGLAVGCHVIYDVIAVTWSD